MTDCLLTFHRKSARCHVVLVDVSFDLFKDFDILGEKMVSCGMDHSLKIWSLQTDAVKKVKSNWRFFRLVNS